MPLLAAEGSATYTTLITTLGTSFQDLTTNTVAMIAAVLPIGITVFGMFMLIGFGKKVFKKIAG